MTREFRERGLIVDEDVSHYDGTTAVVRSAHVSADEIEFQRWRTDRWIKMKHFPAAALHSPLFVFRHAHRMLAHTFTGSSLRSMVGLESAERGVRSDFARAAAPSAITSGSSRRRPRRHDTHPRGVSAALSRQGAASETLAALEAVRQRRQPSGDDVDLERARRPAVERVEIAVGQPAQRELFAACGAPARRTPPRTGPTFPARSGTRRSRHGPRSRAVAAEVPASARSRRKFSMSPASSMPRSVRSVFCCATR